MRPHELYAMKLASDEQSSWASAAKDTAGNIAFGMMSNPRSISPFSLLGNSAGSIFDGFLMRPAIDYGLDVGRRIRSGEIFHSHLEQG